MKETAFGRYPQDPNAWEGGKRIRVENGKPYFNPLARQPIEWMIAAEEPDRMLLTSKYALEYMPFHDWAQTDIAWETSTLRAWLNGGTKNDESFLSDSFTEEERSRILPHRETGDLVFLLSLEELLQYLPKNRDRICLPTPYAASKLPATHRSVSGDPAAWWLRTPSETYKGSFQIVDRKGMYSKTGAVNNMPGVGVRPAVWLRAE